jgi:hypothetical protein
MLYSVKVAGFSFALLVILLNLDWKVTNGFSFDGSTIPCRGVNVTGYPKMKEQFESCNKTTYENFMKRGESTEGFGPMLCTAQCVFVEDELV